MTNDTMRAKALLEEKGVTCVLCRGDRILKSEERGVRPLVRWIDAGEDYRGFCAADRIVGKAAAWLYLLLGIRELYAAVLSRSAARLLEEHGIPFDYGTLTEEIINRKKTGQCPMELAVSDSTSPQEAYAAVKKKLAEMEQMSK